MLAAIENTATRSTDFVCFFRKHSRIIHNLGENIPTSPSTSIKCLCFLSVRHHPSQPLQCDKNKRNFLPLLIQLLMLYIKAIKIGIRSNSRYLSPHMSLILIPLSLRFHFQTDRVLSSTSYRTLYIYRSTIPRQESHKIDYSKNLHTVFC